MQSNMAGYGLFARGGGQAIWPVGSKCVARLSTDCPHQRACRISGPTVTAVYASPCVDPRCEMPGPR